MNMILRNRVFAGVSIGIAISLFSAACTYELPIAAGGGSVDVSSGSTGTSAPWWDTSWKNRVRITFKNASGAPLDEFPVMVRLDAKRIGEMAASTTGADLRFIDSDGKTILPHEIDGWMPGGDSYVWVRVPHIDATDTDYIWLYHGNDAAGPNEKPTDVWKDFLGVYHLSPSLIAPNDFPDSTNTLNGSWENYLLSDKTKPPTVPGVIHRAANFDGVRFINMVDNDHVAADVGEARTAEAWVRMTTPQEQAIVYEEGECVGWFMGTNASGEYYGSFITDMDGTPCGGGAANYPIPGPQLSLNTWHYLVVVVDRPTETMKLYVNGAISSSRKIDNQYIADGNGIFRIGSDHDGGDLTFRGAIDEVRVSDGARSAAWIAAQYSSMKDMFLEFAQE